MDGDDFPVLASLARAYSSQPRPSDADWPYAVALRKGPILSDFTALIGSRIDALRPVVQVRRPGTSRFGPWTKSVSAGYETPERADDDPAQEKGGVLIGGYKKSLYDRNYSDSEFDSKHEKWLADCLEDDM